MARNRKMAFLPLICVGFAFIALGMGGGQRTAFLVRCSQKGRSQLMDTAAPVAADIDRRIRRIAIVGGGTAGWVAAAILVRALPGIAITLVESAEIATVGVGEATIPPFIDLLKFLSIDEADFIRHTQATYKLGIRFDDWRVPGESYWHPFGTFGAAIARRPFHHAWAKARAEGIGLAFRDYSPCARLAERGELLLGPAAERAGVKHALHFDATLVARYLRAYAERQGVTRLERTVREVIRRENGALDALVFDGGERLAADLFLDCSGFAALLIERTLGAGWVDWSDLLPCDTAIAAPTAAMTPRDPFTRATARAGGWRWRIPLQHRTGNGYVYASGAIGAQAALDDFLAAIDGAPLAEPRTLRFRAGRRRSFWTHNCVAIGLASGFLEPLESTSIHLAIRGVMNLLEHFPDRDFNARNIAAYNAELIDEVERARDFIVLHYCLTARDDAEFWRHMRHMPLPDTLTDRIETYRATGRIRPGASELFTDLSWFYVFEGMGLHPRAHDPLLDTLSKESLSSILSRLAHETATVCARAPKHETQLPPSFTAHAA